MTLVEVYDEIFHKLIKIVHLKDKQTKVDSTKIYSYLSSRNYQKSFNFKMGFEWLPEEYENIEDLTLLKFIYQTNKPTIADHNKENVKLSIEKLNEEQEKYKDRYLDDVLKKRMILYYESYIKSHIFPIEIPKYHALIEKYKNNVDVESMKFLCVELIEKNKGKEVKDKYADLEKKANIYFKKDEY